MMTIVVAAFLILPTNYLCTDLFVQVQSERRAQLLVEFCRRDGARRYPIRRGFYCGGVGICTGAPVGARSSENGNRLSVWAFVRASYDGASLSVLLPARGD